MHLFVLIIFVFLSFFGVSQSAYRDQLGDRLASAKNEKALLYQLLKKERSNEKRAVLFYELGHIYEDETNIDSADVCYREALKQAFRIGKENQEIGMAYRKVGYMFSFYGEYDSAIFYIKKSLPYFKDIQLKASSLNSLATMYKYKSEVDVAIENYFGALEIYKQLNDTLNQSVVYSNIGALYRRVKDFEKAKEYLQKGLNLAGNKPAYEKGKFLCKSNLAATYLSEERYKDAIELYNELVQFSKEKQNYSELIVNQANLAGCYTEMGKHSEAFVQYKSLIDVMNELGLKKHKEAILVNMALCLESLENYEEAMLYYHQALALARANNVYAHFDPIYDGLASVHRKLNNADSSLYYKDMQIAVRDSLENLEKEKKLMELEAKHRNKELDEDLKSTKSALDSAENEKSLFATGFAYAVIIIIVTVFVVVFLFVRYKRKKELAKELRERNKQKESKISSLEHSLGDKTEEIERLREKGAVEKLEYPTNLAPLTEREKEVLFGVQEGLKDQEIADKLFISITTVRTHLRKAYVKIDARNRAEAIQFISKHQI